METIIFGLDWTPNTSHVSLFVAAASGAFTRRGLNVRFVSPGLSVDDACMASHLASHMASPHVDMISNS